jgi:hypothetical protein
MVVVQHAAAGLIFLWSLKVIILMGTLNQVIFQPTYSFFAIAG